MEDDYPAAHSMDTTFFAVDAAGHVGVFESGESGHVPESATDVFQLLMEMWLLHHPGAEDSFDVEESAAELGAFLYYFDDPDDFFDTAGPYRRLNAPEVPLHIDQLPPTLRKQVKQIRFLKVDFGRSELVQPLEEYPCVFWDEEGMTAYLRSDGKTVRAIPGKEDRFAEFCERLREENPEAAKKYTFEESPQKAKKPSKRRRKENNDEK